MTPDALEQQQPGGRHERPDAHEEARPEAVGERAETAREEEHHERHRQRRQAALQRRVAADLLQEQDQEEEQRSPAPRTSRTSRRCRPRSSAVGTAPAAASGRARATRHRTNATSSSTPATSGPITAGLDQPSRGCSISANTGPPSPSAHSSAAGHSRRAGPRASRRSARRSRRGSATRSRAPAAR